MLGQGFAMRDSVVGLFVFWCLGFQGRACWTWSLWQALGFMASSCSLGLVVEKLVGFLVVRRGHSGSGVWVLRFRVKGLHGVGVRLCGM